MTYPGSWWEFSDGSIDSCYSWEPVSIADVSIVGSCTVVDEDIHVLPTTSFITLYRTIQKL